MRNYYSHSTPNMGNVLATQFEASPRYLTGDRQPPQPEPEPIHDTTPLINGHVLYADGRRPADFRGQCVFHCDYTSNVSNLRVLLAGVDDVSEITHATLELQITNRETMVRDLNSVKGQYGNTFTVITYNRFCYKFEHVFNKVDIVFVPKIVMTDGSAIYHAFVVIEKPRDVPPPARPSRPLLGRMWSMVVGQDEPEPAAPPSESQVTVLYYDEQHAKLVTTFTDCKVIAKEIESL